MSKKTQEDLDFESLSWQYVAFHHFLMPLPDDWIYEIDTKAGKVRANKGEEAKLTVFPYLVDREKNEGLMASLRKFGKAYEESNFDLCSEIKNTGAFLFQYHSFEGEVLMQISAIEKEYKNELYHLFFVFRAESRAVLQKNMMPIYHIIKRVSVELT